MRQRRWLTILAATALAAGCGSDGGTGPEPSSGASSRRVALTDMGGTNYLGLSGGLYPAGNAIPAAHAAAGRLKAAAIEPLDREGRPRSGGAYVLLSIGMSNTTQEFCSGGSAPPCAPWSFTGQAASDPEVDQSRLAIVNGAAGGKTSVFWDAPDDEDYDRVRDTRLAAQGLAEKQVQIAWLKLANPRPTVSLPAAQADAYTMLAQMGDVVRALKVRYPNLQQVFVSSRIYGGYASTDLNPEPYAYESGWAVKWLIEAQIRQMATAGRPPDARAGDLNYETVAPWIAWGPYLWADGLNARSDGLVWERGDFVSDGTHPSTAGQTKVGAMLLAFFKQSPHTRCWFLAGGRC